MIGADSLLARGRDHEPGLLEGDRAEHLVLLIPRLRAPLRQRGEVEVDEADRGRGLVVGPRGGRGGAADGAVVVAALVPAQRLPRRERLPAQVALVRRRGRRRDRQLRLLVLVVMDGRLPVAGLVAAERLVRRERLAADGARVGEVVAGVRDVAAAAREHDEAQRQVLVLGGLPPPPAGPRTAPLGPPRLLLAARRGVPAADRRCVQERLHRHVRVRYAFIC
jgi:hypothetical protein